MSYPLPRPLAVPTDMKTYPLTQWASPDDNPPSRSGVYQLRCLLPQRRPISDQYAYYSTFGNQWGRRVFFLHQAVPAGWAKLPPGAYEWRGLAQDSRTRYAGQYDTRGQVASALAQHIGPDWWRTHYVERSGGLFYAKKRDKPIER